MSAEFSERLFSGPPTAQALLAGMLAMHDIHARPVVSVPEHPKWQDGAHGQADERILAFARALNVSPVARPEKAHTGEGSNRPQVIEVSTWRKDESTVYPPIEDPPLPRAGRRMVHIYDRELIDTSTIAALTARPEEREPSGQQVRVDDDGVASLWKVNDGTLEDQGYLSPDGIRDVLEILANEHLN